MSRRLRRPLSRLQSALSAQRSEEFPSGGVTAHSRRTRKTAYCCFVGATGEVGDTPNSVVLRLDQIANQCNAVALLINHESYGCVVAEIARRSRDRERISARRGAWRRWWRHGERS